MAPSRAPRRKACQALLPDLSTPCSASFRGWGRYCPAHLEECAILSGRYKDAAARTERQRRQGEMSEKQVRALGNVGMVERAAERVGAYLGALEEEEKTMEAHLRRFPAEKEERHEQRLAAIQERKDMCTTLLGQLQQRRVQIAEATSQRRDRNGRDSARTDLERQPLLAQTSRQSHSRYLNWTLRIVFMVILFTVPLTLYAYFFLGRIGTMAYYS